MSPPLHRVSRVNQVTVAVLIDNFISATLEMETARLAAEAEIVKRKEQVSIRTRDSCAFQGFTLPDRIVSFQSQISKSHDSGIIHWDRSGKLWQCYKQHYRDCDTNIQA